MEENKRLKEIKLSLYINHIDKSKNKIQYNTMMKLLSCLAATIGKNEHQCFTKIVQLTIGDCLLKATSKELVATCKKYFSNRKAAEKLGISNSAFYHRYNDLLNRDYIINDFLESLKPIFNAEHEVHIINILLNFIENFKYELGNDDNDLCTNNRTLEIEFLLIYDKLMEVFNNANICDKFIFNICNLFNIDFNSISQLKNNIHIINRSYPNFRYNNRYLMQEIVTLYTHKGLSKGSIGSKVLGKASSYLYNGTNKKYSIISNDDLAWQYIPTLDWSIIEKESVLKFIDIFHTFINYDVYAFPLYYI